MLVGTLIMGVREKLRREIPQGNRLRLHLEAWDFIEKGVPKHTQMHESNFEFISEMVNQMLKVVCEPNQIVDIDDLNADEIKLLVLREPIKGMLERACVPIRDESLTSLKRVMNSENN